MVLRKVFTIVLLSFLAATQNGSQQAAAPENSEMAPVPAGVFWMGCNASVDDQCYDDEKPYHKVLLDAFSIDKFEVTVERYAACVKAGKCKEPDSGTYCNWGKSDRGNHPVNCVNWSQAKDYCEWTGKRLPTEAEWEKAARGADGRKYPWGNQELSCDYAVMNDGKNGCGKDSTWPVGSKPKGASPYGAMDMAGNVSEWTADWYDFSYYTKSPPDNPKGITYAQSRVQRGGSWGSPVKRLRVTARYANPPGNKNMYFGFRCVR